MAETAKSNPWKGLATPVVVALICLGTLRPWSNYTHYFGAPHPFGWKLALRPDAASDLVANIAMFVVLGLALSLRGTRFRDGVLFGFALSLLIEVLQMWIPTRAPDVLDVLANGFGTAIGLGFVARYPDWFRPRTDARALHLLTLHCVASALVMVAAALLLRPVPISGGMGFIHAPPQFDNVENWHGLIDTATLNGVPLSWGSTREPGWIWEALGGDYSLEIRGTAPRLSMNARRPVFVIAGGRPHRIAFWLASQGDDLLIRTHVTGQTWHFNRTFLRARGFAHDLVPASPFELRIWRSERRTCLRLNERTDCSLHPTTAETWRPFAPSLDLWLGHAPVLSTAWLGALVLPIGFYLRRRALGYGCVVGLIAVHGALPFFTALRPMSIRHAIAALFFFGFGIALSRISKRRSPIVKADN